MGQPVAGETLVWIPAADNLYWLWVRAVGPHSASSVRAVGITAAAADGPAMAEAEQLASALGVRVEIDPGGPGAGGVPPDEPGGRPPSEAGPSFDQPADRRLDPYFRRGRGDGSAAGAR